MAKLQYPYNLIRDIIGDKTYLDIEIKKDNIDGLKYILKKLTDTEYTVVVMKYKYCKSMKAIVDEVFMSNRYLAQKCMEGVKRKLTVGFNRKYVILGLRGVECEQYKTQAEKRKIYEEIRNSNRSLQDISVLELKFSTRVESALLRADILTVARLVEAIKYSGNGIKFLRNVGSKSEEEIKNVLANIGVVTY